MAAIGSRPFGTATKPDIRALVDAFWQTAETAFNSATPPEFMTQEVSEADIKKLSSLSRTISVEVFRRVKEELFEWSLQHAGEDRLVLDEISKSSVRHFAAVVKDLHEGRLPLGSPFDRQVLDSYVSGVGVEADVNRIERGLTQDAFLSGERSYRAAFEQGDLGRAHTILLGLIAQQHGDPFTAVHELWDRRLRLAAMRGDVAEFVLCWNKFKTETVGMDVKLQRQSVETVLGDFLAETTIEGVLIGSDRNLTVLEQNRLSDLYSVNARRVLCDYLQALDGELSHQRLSALCIRAARRGAEQTERWSSSTAPVRVIPKFRKAPEKRPGKEDA